jgi:TonB family protein
MMINRRLTSLFPIGFFILAFPIGALSHSAVSQPGVCGIGLQPQLQDDETVESLRAAVKRNKNDLTAWNHLGLALEQKGDTKEARKAHEKAAKLGDKILADQLHDAWSGEEFSRRLSPLKATLAEAGASAEKYIQLAKLSGNKLQEWKLRADSLMAFAEIAHAPPGTPAIFSSKEVSVKARVLTRPEPSYTEEARQSQITGTVVLRAIFAANGRVIGIRVVSGLSGGLSERAIEAARKIKFLPAMKDGRPVSMFIQIEYSFNLY